MKKLFLIAGLLGLVSCGNKGTLDLPEPQPKPEVRPEIVIVEREVEVIKEVETIKEVVVIEEITVIEEVAVIKEVEVIKKVIVKEEVEVIVVEQCEIIDHKFQIEVICDSETIVVDKLKDITLEEFCSYNNFWFCLGF